MTTRRTALTTTMALLALGTSAWAPARVEPGGWLIAPGPDPQEVRVDVYDPRRPGIVIDVGIFDARTGAMVRIVGAK